MKIDLNLTDNGDTASATFGKVPFVKAKDVRAEFEAMKSNGMSGGDDLLRRILTSLSKGRADDQRAVAEIGKQIMELGKWKKAKPASPV